MSIGNNYGRRMGSLVLGAAIANLVAQRQDAKAAILEADAPVEKDPIHKGSFADIDSITVFSDATGMVSDSQRNLVKLSPSMHFPALPPGAEFRPEDQPNDTAESIQEKHYWVLNKRIDACASALLNSPMMPLLQPVKKRKPKPVARVSRKERKSKENQLVRDGFTREEAKVDGAVTVGSFKVLTPAEEHELITPEDHKAIQDHMKKEGVTPAF